MPCSGWRHAQPPISASPARHAAAARHGKLAPGQRAEIEDGTATARCAIPHLRRLSDVAGRRALRIDRRCRLPDGTRAGVPEVWLVHPGDRILTIFRLRDKAYGRPIIQELQGETAVGTVPDVVIAWDKVLARLD